MKQNSTNYGIYRPMNWLVLIIALVFISGVGYSQVAINTDNSAPDASAMLDVKATGMGFLAPRMTFANRPAAPATGLLIYQTDSNPGYYYFDGAVWQKVGSTSNHYWGLNGTDIFNTNAGNVYLGAVGTSDGHKLNVEQYNTGKSAVRGTEASGAFLYSEGNLGVLNWPSNPMGLPKDIANIGVLGIKPANGVEGTGVYGWNIDGNNAENYGGIFVADGSGISNTNYGVYAEADSAGTANYAGYFKGRVHIEGNNVNDGAADSLQYLLVSEVTHSSSADTRALQGISTPREGYGIAVEGIGGYMGVRGQNNGGEYSGSGWGVYGYATGSAGTRYGVYGYAYNTGTQAVGVYGQASGATTNWAGYFAGDVYVSSDVRIGGTTAATGYALSVHGKVACEEVLIDDDAFWPDYVFADDYELLSIDEFEESINENNHLPGMPSAQDIENQGGFEVGDIQKKTLEKVEELSLYIIELNNRMKNLEKENQELKAQVLNQ